MDSKVSNIRPHHVPSVPPAGRRRDSKDGQPRKSFELGSERASPPPDPSEDEPRDASERSVTPPEPDEAGARLDVTA